MITNLSREGGFGFDIECDTCEQVTFIDQNEFRDAIAEAKSLGWRVYKEDGEWCHECPDCQRKG